MMVNEYENAIKAIAERIKLGYQIYGLDSEKFYNMLEEEAMFNFQLKRLPQALTLMQKLICTLKDIHGSENYQKILGVLEHIG